MIWLNALVAGFPLFSKLLDLFTKTPEEKQEAVLKALLNYVEDINTGVKKSVDTGDTSDLEKALNRHR